MSKNNFQIITVGGTRPEIIKLANLIPLLNKNYDHAFVYTGQHYSSNMKDIFIDELNITPDFDLKCNSSNIITIKEQMSRVLKNCNPKYVLVYGDTNSSMAAALFAEEKKSRIIHLEAGVRDFDYQVPEEPLRIKIDEMSEHLFAPSDFCKTVLSYENVTGQVYNEGNLVVDVCKRLSKIAEKLPIRNEIPKDFLLLTIHRPENSDDEVNLKRLMNHFEKVTFPIVFPIHPRTKNNLLKYNISVPKNIITIDPLGYIEFLSLLLKCKLVLTDSGGLQEEAVTLKKPCVTLRHTSARWETILMKANILFPPDNKDDLNKIIEMMLGAKITRNPYGENVAEKTIKVLDNVFENL